MKLIVLELLPYIGGDGGSYHTSPSLGDSMNPLYSSLSSSYGCMGIPKLEFLFFSSCKTLVLPTTTRLFILFFHF
jgi:hypothetical protein